MIPGRKPRNVVFILADDHRFDFMGFMGKVKFLETPNMDRLAREGAHLQNAFVTTALCSPSRASILTGLFSHKHGVVDNQTNIQPGLVFFPQYLQQLGYRTAFMGKWHMGHESDEPRPGFDKWISFRGQGEYYDTMLNIDGKQVKSTKHISDELTDYAVEWLKQDRDKPFFLYLSHKAVHAMFAPAKRHLGKYENVTLEYPTSMADTEENYRGKPAWVKEQRNSWHGVDYMDGRSLLPLLEGKDAAWRDAVFYEYYWEAAFPQTPTTFGVRTDRYKFICYHGIWDIDELYDVQNDPDEMHNLIDRPEHKQLIANLKKRLYDWLDKTGGMQIPLRREVGGRSDKRGPKQVKQYKYYEQSK